MKLGFKETMSPTEYIIKGPTEAQLGELRFTTMIRVLDWIGTQISPLINPMTMFVEERKLWLQKVEEMLCGDGVSYEPSIFSAKEFPRLAVHEEAVQWSLELIRQSLTVEKYIIEEYLPAVRGLFEMAGWKINDKMQAEQKGRLRFTHPKDELDYEWSDQQDYALVLSYIESIIDCDLRRTWQEKFPDTLMIVPEIDGEMDAMEHDARQKFAYLYRWGMPLINEALVNYCFRYDSGCATCQAADAENEAYYKVDLYYGGTLTPKAKCDDIYLEGCLQDFARLVNLLKNDVRTVVSPEHLQDVEKNAAKMRLYNELVPRMREQLNWQVSVVNEQIIVTRAEAQGIKAEHNYDLSFDGLKQLEREMETFPAQLVLWEHYRLEMLRLVDCATGDWCIYVCDKEKALLCTYTNSDNKQVYPYSYNEEDYKRFKVDLARCIFTYRGEEMIKR